MTPQFLFFFETPAAAIVGAADSAIDDFTSAAVGSPVDDGAGANTVGDFDSSGQGASGNNPVTGLGDDTVGDFASSGAGASVIEGAGDSSVGEFGSAGTDTEEEPPSVATPSPFRRAALAALGPIYLAFGEDATYTPSGGSVASVRVIRSRPDDRVGLGGGFVVSDSQVLEVRVSEVSDPAAGDLFEIDGETFVVQGEPRRDGERLIWRIDARPQA